jgi:hypothetical protein
MSTEPKSQSVVLDDLQLAMTWKSPMSCMLAVLILTGKRFNDAA